MPAKTPVAANLAPLSPVSVAPAPVAYKFEPVFDPYSALDGKPGIMWPDAWLTADDRRAA